MKAIVATVLLFGLAMVGNADVTLYVSPTGNDAWSGRLPEANAAQTDGPVATLTRARDAVRAAKAQGEPVTVLLRGGRYFVEETIVFTPEDGGTEAAPVTWASYPGETPVLIGGRVIAGFTPQDNGTLVARIPEVAAGQWQFRQLFCDGQRLIRARHPNFDPADPYRSGFMYVQRALGDFDSGVGNIHNVGDWMDYDLDIPVDGQWQVWVRYGHNMQAFNRGDMGGQTAFRVDGGEPVPLLNLPDTGSWAASAWSHSATLTLTAGRHRLRWENLKGGGLNLDAFALTDDPTWRAALPLPPVAEGRHLIVLQAEDFVAFNGKQLSAGGGSKTAFRMNPGDIPTEWVVPGAEVHIFQSGSCRAFKEIVSLESVDPQTGVVRVSGPECVAPLCLGDRFFVENVPQALDAPGEWYLDTQSGELTVIPPTDAGADSEYIAPVTSRIFEFAGEEGRPVEHLTLRGLTLTVSEYTPDDGCGGYGMGNNGAVYLANARHCAIEDCEFLGLGRYAVCINGGGDNRVSYCHIADSAQGGVLILGSAGNVVSDCHIHDCGAIYKHIGGVVLQGKGTDDNVVAHNWIHDMSRYGISIKNGGLRNVIEFNRVERTNLETYDTGGIEVTQHDPQLRSGSIIRNNVVGDTVGYSSRFHEPVYLSWAIYLDSYAGGYTVENNICYRTSHGGIMLQGGKGNIVRNNIFVEATVCQMLFANFRQNFEDEVVERNVVCWTAPDVPLIRGGTSDTKVLRVDYNLYWCPGLQQPALVVPKIGSWGDWLAAGQDAHSIFADPKFVAPERDDYTLLPDSPAFALGFQPIDTSTVGPRPR